jgi:DNA-binding transcriptional MerR regulator
MDEASRMVKSAVVRSKRAKTVEAAGEQIFTSSDVARISGVSLRQLQWWDERNVVSPRQDGHRRVYAPAEVVEVSVIAALRKKGFSLQKIRRVLRYLQKEMGRRLADAVEHDSEIHLLTDGKTIYLEESADRVVDLMKNARQPMFLVCVTDQLRRFQLASQADKKKPARSAEAAASSTTGTRARLG